MELRTAMSRLDRERPALALLVLAFLLLSGWMLAQPHDLVAAGHLKDEEGYYPWAELYLDGYWSLPLQLANGDYRDEEVVSIDSGVPPLQVAWEIVALDPDVMREARTPLSVKWPGGEVEGHFLEVRRTDTFGDLLSRYDKGET